MDNNCKGLGKNNCNQKNGCRYAEGDKRSYCRSVARNQDVVKPTSYQKKVVSVKPVKPKKVKQVKEKPVKKVTKKVIPMKPVSNKSLKNLIPVKPASNKSLKNFIPLKPASNKSFKNFIPLKQPLDNDALARMYRDDH